MLRRRGLERFTRDNPSITQGVQLPEPEHSAKMAWPVPTVPLGVQVASGMVMGTHSGAAWAADVQRRADDRRVESAGVAAYHRGKAKEQEEREAPAARSNSSG
jgi:hypothetical protein